MTDILVVTGVLLSLIFYGAWMLHRSETQALNQFVQKANFLESKVRNLEEKITEQNKSIASLDSLFKSVSDKCLSATSEVDKVQDHLHRVRSSMMQLQDKLSRKRPVIQFQNPVPVEFVEESPKAKVMRKVKKQIRDLSK